MPVKLFLRVTFDAKDKTATFEDVSSYVANGYSLSNIKGLLKITYPDGLEQDFSSLSSPPLSASNSLKFINDLRTDADGGIMLGVYTFVYKAYNGASLIDTITREIDYQYESKDLEISQEIDNLTPNISVNDSTDYTLDEFTYSLDRTWIHQAKAISSTKYISYNQVNSLTLGGSFYSAVYDVSLTVSIQYNKDENNSWFSIKDEITKSEIIKVYVPLMIPEILALINCLYAKRKAMECCEDAQYLLISSDYELVMGLFQNFVSNGQASITSGQSDLLTEMLAIFKKWGCADDGTIANTALANYDWCLCDGGGGDSGKYNYDAGNGAYVSATVDNDVTFSKLAGVGTFTVGTGHLLGGTIRGTSADAVYDSDGVTQSFKIVIPVKDASAAYSSLLLGSIQVWDASNYLNVSDSTPLVMDDGAVQKRIVGISSNTVSIVVCGIGATYSAGWVITFVNP